MHGTDCSVIVCNDPATPVSVGAMPDVSWAVDPAIPAGSFWRVIFRPTDNTGTAASESFGQLRTPFMQSGDFGLNIVGGIATWTNPGTLDLTTGIYEVQIYVYDSDGGSTSIVFGVTSGPGGVGNDLTYITVP